MYEPAIRINNRRPASHSAQPNSSPTGGGWEGAALLRLRIPRRYLTPWYTISDDYDEAVEICMKHITDKALVEIIGNPIKNTSKSSAKLQNRIMVAIIDARKRFNTHPECTVQFNAIKWHGIEIQVMVKRT